MFSEMLGEVSRGEVVSGINQVNVDKSPGPDGLHAELYERDDVVGLLTSVFNLSLRSGVLCDSFCQDSNVQGVLSSRVQCRKTSNDVKCRSRIYR